MNGTDKKYLPKYSLTKRRRPNFLFHPNAVH